MANLTTFRIGGKADFFVAIKNTGELVQAADWARAKKMRVLILGGGSNILIESKRIKGLVIKIAGEDCKINKDRVRCWAGTGLTRLAEIVAKAGLSGLEWAWGIPGTIGGAVSGNAGAYGSSMSDVVEEVEAYDLAKKKFVKFSRRDCCFGYRESLFKKTNDLIIAGVVLKLKQSEPGRVKGLSMKNFNHRFKKVPKEPSAGCVFKNVEYGKAVRQNKILAEELAAKGLAVGGKISAGYLIDATGLKGKRFGQAKISEKHANFIINEGSAGSEDVRRLIGLIKRKIKEKYKINLEEEIRHI